VSSINAATAGSPADSQPSRTGSERPRPRVLLVAPVAVDGGVVEVLSGLVRRCEEGGYVPTIVFLRDGPAVSRFAACGPVVLHAGHLRRPLAFVRTVIALDRIVRRARPDVVVAMEPSAHLYAAGPAWWTRVPAVCMHHGLPDRGSRIDRLAGKLPCAMAVVNSMFVLERCRSLTKAPLRVVQPGVDVDAMANGDGHAIRQNFGIPAHAPLLAIVGRLQAWKGQALFLEAAALVAARDPEARFAVVGGANMGWEDPGYPRMLHELAERLAIADRVTFAGHTRHVPDWMAAADVAVHASQNEPYGLVLCEALASGCAVVSVAEGGPLELIRHGQTGLLTPRDARSLASAMNRLVADPPLRRRLGSAGRAQARERMSDVRMARGFGGVLTTVTRRPRRRRQDLERLRVMFVAPVSVQGGANEVLLALADPGDHGAYDSLVVALRAGPLVDRLVAGDVEHVLLNAPRMRSLVATGRAIRQLDRLIHSWRPDVVFSGEASGHVYAALPAARQRVPALWRQPARPSARDPMDLIANRLPARGVVVASRFIAAEQEQAGPRPVSIIAPGIAVGRLDGADGPRLRREQGIPTDAVLVTIVGRLQPWKGQDLFLHAAAEVASAHPDARFAIVGGAEMGWETGDFPRALRELASSLGIAERVCFSGQTDDVSHWYGASDIVVHASDHEPFGLVLCEAMLMGCAVVATDEGGPREIIDHERTGLLIERNAAAMGRAIERMLADPVHRRRLGEAAREVAARQFTSARMVRDFEALMHEHARC
jgi:glycosyltransferase involved in cell wall biosynthesis